MSQFVSRIKWGLSRAPWSRWHLSTDNRITWCGLQIPWSTRTTKHDLWRGERDGVCRSCLYQLDTHGAKKGLHRKKERGCRTGINR